MPRLSRWRSRPTPHLYQNHTPSFTLINFDNASFTIGMPEFAYVELTDNREWNWAIFALQIHVPFNGDNPHQKFSIGSGAATTPRRPVRPRRISSMPSVSWLPATGPARSRASTSSRPMSPPNRPTTPA